LPLFSSLALSLLICRIINEAHSPAWPQVKLGNHEVSSNILDLRKLTTSNTTNKKEVEFSAMHSTLTVAALSEIVAALPTLARAGCLVQAWV
jgi:hypothetical protein